MQNESNESIVVGVFLSVVCGAYICPVKLTLQNIAIKFRLSFVFAW